MYSCSRTAKQLDALASLCGKHQLTDNLSKTKVMIFEAQHGCVADLMLSSADVESVVSFEYLGFTFHATRDMSFGTGFLVAAATEAILTMQQQCALLGIRALLSSATYLPLSCYPF